MIYRSKKSIYLILFSESLSVQERASELDIFISRFPNKLGEIFKYVMKESGLTLEEISDATWINKRMLSRWKRGDSPSIKYLTYFIVGLNIVPEVSDVLFDKARFRTDGKEYFVWKYLKDNCYLLDISDFTEKLESEQLIGLKNPNV